MRSPQDAQQRAAPSLEDLRARAREMIPNLRGRAQETEERRRISERTAQSFRDAGFFRVLQPSRYGGFEMDYGTHMRLAIEIGQGCASSAWVLAVLASHSWILGMFPPKAQDEIWPAEPGALVATSFLPIEPKV